MTERSDDTHAFDTNSPSGHARERHDRELVVRRLEAFSDVVIGLSLAQLGLSLVLPVHAADFIQRPVALIAFMVTFVVVTRFWWTHFRIFRRYFMPNRLMITCNFIALASLIVQVFSLQLYLHFAATNDGLVAARIYFAFFSLAYGFLGITFALGVWYCWSALDWSQRREGLRDVIAILGTVIGCIVGNISSAHSTTNILIDVSGKRQLVATMPSTIALGTLAGWLIGMVAGRAIMRRLPR